MERLKSLLLNSNNAPTILVTGLVALIVLGFYGFSKFGSGPYPDTVLSHDGFEDKGIVIDATSIKETGLTLVRVKVKKYNQYIIYSSFSTTDKVFLVGDTVKISGISYVLTQLDDGRNTIYEHAIVVEN